MVLGTTGVAAKHLQGLSIPHIISTTHNGSHAGYYPGAQQMSIQIAFSPENGKLLSAQIAGYDGVDKRLDVFASIIQNGGTIYDLIEFEHAYAPPFSSAKDPANMAGFVAENILHGVLKVAHWNGENKAEEGDLLVDVRTAEEYNKGTIEGAINIPVDELRNRLSELPKDQKIFIFCQIGLRGYLAQRMLIQNDYQNVLNISGGFFLWNAVRAEKEQLAN